MLGRIFLNFSELWKHRVFCEMKKNLRYKTNHCCSIYIYYLNRYKNTLFNGVKIQLPIKHCWYRFDAYNNIIKKNLRLHNVDILSNVLDMLLFIQLTMTSKQSLESQRISILTLLKFCAQKNKG
jgi:hypothetical protein